MGQVGACLVKMIDNLDHLLDDLDEVSFEFGRERPRLADKVRPKAEQLHAIDVNAWHREGWLRAGNSFTWRLEGRDLNDKILDIQMETDSLVLTFLPDGIAAEKESEDQHVLLAWTDCHFGSRRPWFQCPSPYGRSDCLGRCANLYLGFDGLLACRRCHRLLYSSQWTPPQLRGLVRAERIRRRLGGESGYLRPFPGKPRGMHWRTYFRLEEQAELAERMSVLEIAQPRVRYDAAQKRQREGTAKDDVQQP